MQSSSHPIFIKVLKIFISSFSSMKFFNIETPPRRALESLIFLREFFQSEHQAPK